ncbi:MAG: hypothetical protein EZS28_011300 [Streblomastix strix]|uniref:Uncharacterized protein n=1 Tax=Streblomastix strix TaxID=222440 RepID=A0A5J4WDV2_9EUKA|nr:MAG: hypothetical protein EZS28_011300 [Streblomastix strix]
MIYEDQSPLHQESNTRKVAFYSFVIIVYELPLETKLRPEVQWFNEHDYTRSIDCKYNICWFIAASFQLHSEINQTKARIANVGGYLCKKCNQRLINRTSDNFSRDLKKHLESYKGPDQQKHPKLDKLAQPFMPYLKQNKIIQKLFATGQTKLFLKDQEQGVSDILQPTKYYMCIDAETVEDQAQDDEANGLASESIHAQLLPLSIVIGSQIRNKIQTQYLDINVNDFMNKFIEQMWEPANQVNEANFVYEQIVKFDNENEQQKHQQKIYKVTIFGFNSKNKAYLGSTTQQKEVTIRHVDFQFELVFQDVLTFISPTTLDNFVHKYGNGTKLTKGQFPHESFNTSNVNQQLSSSEPFDHKDFYNQIRRKSNNDKEYQEYFDDFVSLDANGNRKFKDRWANLEFYNIRDVECMEDLDINGDYNIETRNKEQKFYSEKQNKKVESYLQQDVKAGRDAQNNVTVNDMDYFNRMIPNKCCYCQAKFTSINKPILERIDNDIVHTKDNCKLACQLCNSTRSNKDADVAKLMIQMYKYAIVKNLPITIDEEEVYWFLRKSIHGGLSQVFHQYNIKGLTHINKLKYNPEENNVTAYDLDYIITHILNLDFNSLYPSAFCGIYNKNNPYTGRKKYMAGRVTKHIKIREANDQDYRDTKCKEMMNIINSEDRFSEEKGQLFIASVKGHIDKNHINNHINFPLIWRKRTYKTDEKTIGKFTYEKMQKQGISVNKQVTKLISLLSTHDEFMSFRSYYLWLLIDYCHFIIYDVEEIALFTKHTAFKSFVEVMAEKRQQAM